jgi:predicted SAM-dependent methyltransferase
VEVTAEEEKPKRRKLVKLNLGAGDTKIKGYTPVDRKFGQEVYPLGVPDNSVHTIRASHVLEHFGHQRAFVVVRNWVAKLKIGGILKVAVPDFKKIAAAYVRGSNVSVQGYLMGGQADENDFHRSLYDRVALWQLFEAAGLEDIKEWKSEIKDCADLPISLNLQGTKKRNYELSPLTEIQKKKVAAVMSMPRLAFTDNLFSAMRGLLPAGITLERGQGVFWGQILTRMIEKHLDDGTDWLFTLDYDTWFLQSHVVRLMQLLACHPEADAITSVQIQRDGVLPLVSRKEAGKPLPRVALTEFQRPLTRVSTGHFGLTLFRASALKKLKKPWFWAKPGPDKSWNEGRVDEDIYFWHNWEKSGLKLFMANEVFIGHMQMVCTFPGVPELNWQPIHTYMNDLENSGPPGHCVPSVICSA